MQLAFPLLFSATGNLMGGAIGGAIGYLVGSYLVAEKQTITTGKTGDGFYSPSSYGVPIARVYGTDRVEGQTWWSTEPVEHVSKQSTGKGGGVEYENYYKTISRQIVLCESPVGGILGVRRVWLNNEVVIDQGGNPLPGTLYLGTNTQVQDPVMQSYLGTRIPAYRGLVYIVTEDEYLVNGVVNNYSFEVVCGDWL